MTSSEKLPWHQDGIDLILHLQIQPRSSKNQFCGINDEKLKLKITAPPVDGAANAACIEFLAKTLKVPKSRILIESGETARIKRVRILECELNKIEELLNPAK